jgi:hypothetical protein
VPITRFLLLSDSCRFVDVGHPLWWEDWSVVNNYRWTLPVQSFLGSSPTGLTTIFYCLRFETPTTWRARSPYLYSSGTRWSSYTPVHWIPFLLPLITYRATVEVFGSPPHGVITPQVKVKVILWPSQSVLVSGTCLGSRTRFVLLPDSCGFVDVWAPSLTMGWVLVYLVCKSQSHCNWQSVGVSCLLLFDSYCCVFVGRHLWQNDGSQFTAVSQLTVCTQ